MTDKQIIIDVTQCPYYKEDKTCTYLPYKTKCEGDCNWTAYKEMEEKLKAKEQECEELKKQLKEMNEVIRTETTRCSLVNILKTELDQLKAENEELTTINARLLGRLEVDETDTSLVFNLDKELRQKEKEFYTAIQKVVKLKQTLTEIKEIAKKLTRYAYMRIGSVPIWIIQLSVPQKQNVLESVETKSYKKSARWKNEEIYKKTN